MNAVVTRLSGKWAHFESAAFASTALGSLLVFPLFFRTKPDPLLHYMAVAGGSIVLSAAVALTVPLRSMSQAAHVFAGACTFAIAPLIMAALSLANYELPPVLLMSMAFWVAVGVAGFARSEVMLGVAMLMAVPAVLSSTVLAIFEKSTGVTTPVNVVLVGGALIVAWRRNWYVAFLLARYPGLICFFIVTLWFTFHLSGASTSGATACAFAGLALVGMLTCLDVRDRFVRAAMVVAMIAACLPLLYAGAAGFRDTYFVKEPAYELAILAAVIILASPGLHFLRDKPFLLAPIAMLVAFLGNDDYAVALIVQLASAAVLILWGISLGIRNGHPSMIYWGLAGMFFWTVVGAATHHNLSDYGSAITVMLAGGASTAILMVAIFWWAWPRKLLAHLF